MTTGNNDETEFALVKLVLENEEVGDGDELAQCLMMPIAPFDTERMPGDEEEEEDEGRPAPLLTLGRLIRKILIHNPKWVSRIVRDDRKKADGDHRQEDAAWISIGDGCDLLVLIDDAVGPNPFRAGDLPGIRLEGFLTDGDDDDDDDDFVMEPSEHVFPFVRSERTHSGQSSAAASALLLRAKSLAQPYLRNYHLERHRNDKPKESYLSSVLLLRTEEHVPPGRGVTEYRQEVADAWWDWTKNKSWLLESDSKAQHKKERSNDARRAHTAAKDLTNNQKEAPPGDDTDTDTDTEDDTDDAGHGASKAKSKNTVKRANRVGGQPGPSTSKAADDKDMVERGQAKDENEDKEEEEDSVQPQMIVIPDSVPDHLEPEANLTSKQILLLEKGYHDTITKSDEKLQGKRSSREEKLEAKVLFEKITILHDDESKDTSTEESVAPKDGTDQADKNNADPFKPSARIANALECLASKPIAAAAATTSPPRSKASAASTDETSPPAEKESPTNKKWMLRSARKPPCWTN